LPHRREKDLLARQQITTEGILRIDHQASKDVHLFSGKNDLLVLLVKYVKIMNEYEVDGKRRHEGETHYEENNPDFLLNAKTAPLLSQSVHTAHDSMESVWKVRNFTWILVLISSLDE
ncbi:MAG: hypothetical protein ACREJU_17555, partial [Nitrospiraceae bacterium]